MNSSDYFTLLCHFSIAVVIVGDGWQLFTFETTSGQDGILGDMFYRLFAQFSVLICIYKFVDCMLLGQAYHLSNMNVWYFCVIALLGFMFEGRISPSFRRNVYSLVGLRCHL